MATELECWFVIACGEARRPIRGAGRAKQEVGVFEFKSQMGSAHSAGQTRRATKRTHMDHLALRHAKSFAGADGCPVSSRVVALMGPFVTAASTCKAPTREPLNSFARAQNGPKWAQLQATAVR